MNVAQQQATGAAEHSMLSGANWLFQLLFISQVQITVLFSNRRLRSGLASSLLADTAGSLSVSLCSASASPDWFSTPLRHLRLATAGALSVQEPLQRFSCSRRFVLAESPIVYPRRNVYL